MAGPYGEFGELDANRDVNRVREHLDEGEAIREHSSIGGAASLGAGRDGMSVKTSRPGGYGLRDEHRRDGLTGFQDRFRGLVQHPAGQAALWASVACGAALGIERILRGRSMFGSIAGFALAGLGGGVLLYDRFGPGPLTGIHIVHTFTIRRPVAEVYRFWRDLENLPRVMSHVSSIRQLDERRSHWIVQGPAGVAVEWDAEITADERERLIVWRSLEGSDVCTSGSVRFLEVTGGTEVRVHLDYRPPAGVLGHAVATMFGSNAEQIMVDDMTRLQRLLESGSAALVAGFARGA